MRIMQPLFDERIIQINASVAGNNLYDAFGDNDKPSTAFQSFKSKLKNSIEIYPDSNYPEAPLAARGTASQKSIVTTKYVKFKGSTTAVADNTQTQPGDASCCSLSLLTVGFRLWGRQHININGSFENTDGDTPGPEFSHVILLKNSFQVEDPVLHFYQGSAGRIGTTENFSDSMTLIPGLYVIKAGVFCNVAGSDNDAAYAMSFKLTF